MKKLSIKELEARADKLSSYDGNPPMIYSGQDDPLIHFSGSIQNFAGEQNLNKQFRFAVTNGGVAATRTAVIWPGYLIGNSTLAPGQLADGAFNAKDASVGLSGASQSQKTIAELFQFLIRVPSRIWAIGIRSTVEAQIAENMTVYAKSPFDADTTYQIRPSDYQDQNVQQLKIIQVPVDLQLDYETLIEMPFVASSVTNLIFYFGASLNIARGLRVKAAEAKAQINNYGGSQRIIRDTQGGRVRMLGS